MKIICIIPARYQSTRFPGKPLALINNHPMISWVYHRASSVLEFDETLVATDDRRIETAVINFGGKAVLTPEELPSGTDRVAYVARTSDADIVVNLQGDEPLISPDLLSAICKSFSDESVQMTTAIKKASNLQELKNPGAAWVVVDNNMDALYFSRAVLPVNYKFYNMSDWLNRHTYYEHVGIYAYRREFLMKLSTLSRGQLEICEDLEQLRVLEHGYKIRCVLTSYQSVCVDTPQDLLIVEKMIQEKKIKLDENDEKM